MFIGAKKAAGGSIVRKCCNSWSSYEVPPASDKLRHVVEPSEPLPVEVLSIDADGVSGVSGARRSAEKFPSSTPGVSVAGSDCDAGLAVKVIRDPVVKSRCFCSSSEVIPPINPSISNSDG